MHSLLLLAAGLGMMLLRPCRSRADQVPRLAVALMLLSAAAAWLGALGALVWMFSGQPGLSVTACGVVKRQLVSGQLPWWQSASAIAWLVVLPGRGLAALAADVRRNKRLLRTFEAAGTLRSTSAYGPVLVVPGLSTPAVTLGVFRPVVVVDGAFWQTATSTQREVVLAHEQGHVRGRHGMISAVARVLTAGLAPLPSADATSTSIRRHLEALADAAAARRHDRRTVGVALGRIALAAYPPAGLGAAGASVWRVRRLVTAARPTMRERLLLWSMVAAISVCLVFATAEAAHALGPVIDPSYCPLR